jgi:hypothetical protein
MPCSSRIPCALPPSGPPDGVRRCLLERSASGPSPLAISPPESLHSWWCRRSCFLLAAVRGAQPRGGWCSSAIARLQGFSSCSSTAVPRQWPSRRMTTSLVVGRSKLGCDLPHPQLQGCSSSSLGWRASEVGALPSAWAGDPLLPPAFGGEGHSPALRRRRTSATRGRLAAGRQLQRVWPFGLDGFGAASDAASCRLAGAWLSVHCTGNGRAMRGSATSIASPARRLHWGVVQDAVRRGIGGHVLGWYCPHSHGRTGARTPSCVLRQPPSTGAEVGAVVGAEVVATAGKATRCKGGRRRWRDHQSHLPPSPRLFGFNGLVVTESRLEGGGFIWAKFKC